MNEFIFMNSFFYKLQCIVIKMPAKSLKKRRIDRTFIAIIPIAMAAATSTANKWTFSAFSENYNNRKKKKQEKSLLVVYFGLKTLIKIRKNKFQFFLFLYECLFNNKTAAMDALLEYCLFAFFVLKILALREGMLRKRKKGGIINRLFMWPNRICKQKRIPIKCWRCCCCCCFCWVVFLAPSLNKFSIKILKSFKKKKYFVFRFCLFLLNFWD